MHARIIYVQSEKTSSVFWLAKVNQKIPLSPITRQMIIGILRQRLSLLPFNWSRDGG